MRTYVRLLWIAVFMAGCSKSEYIDNPGGLDLSHIRAVGASASDLLDASTYTSLKIEIQYSAGYEPDAGAIAHLQSMLSGLLNKPDGISIVTKQIGAPSSQVLSADELYQIEKVNRTVYTSGSQVGVYVLYTNGEYTTNNTLGVAYKNTSIALMGKKIHDNSGGIGQASRTKLEATVLEHEFAHLLGLVDLGSPMQSDHKDPEHGNHCNNSSCLMYYASETTDILGFLITGNIPSLDTNCQADLMANGGQ